MALELADLPVRPITVDEALRMFDAGVFEAPSRIELLRGILVEKPVSSPQHSEAKTRVSEWLWGLGPRILRIEDPVVGWGVISMPKPDLAVVAPGDYSREHPAAALLVVEISKSSFVVDIKVKAPIYAAMGVPDYWVVDLERQRVLVHRDPTPDGYARPTVHRAPEQLQPIAVDIEPFDLNALFS